MEVFSSRTARLLGQDAVERLSRCEVAVFGLGGVGSFTAEALARSGVGKLLLIDGDTVSVSNRNRQLPALRSTLGQPKTQVMAQRIQDINPDCTVEIRTQMITADTDLSFLNGCDFVADAIDCVPAKLAIYKFCNETHIPVIAAMGCGNRTDLTQLRITDIFRTQGCPLCKKIRTSLRKTGIDRLTVVASDEVPAAVPDVTDEAGRITHPPASAIFVPATAGLLMAQHIVLTLTRS